MYYRRTVQLDTTKQSGTYFNKISEYTYELIISNWMLRLCLLTDLLITVNRNAKSTTILVSKIQNPFQEILRPTCGHFETAPCGCRIETSTHHCTTRYTGIEYYNLLRYDAVSIGKYAPTFRRSLLHPISMSSHLDVLDPENGCSKLHWKIGNYLPVGTE